MEDKQQDVNQANSVAIPAVQTAQLEQVIPNNNKAIVKLSDISTLVFKANIAGRNI